ncbi:4Fe-4S ferredoxin [Dehalococcoides mccartyi]|uniref:4Fe-4S dicluster domain-containing protein n=1 Tax=Dehalococcoides mccartyi TaxID=61435 RepID=UPI00071DF02A|nr:ferredoxin family protein [Dehalococcoides mccartyi]KSV17561.1 4Fe-4S ferredoxin [Dehalococcoides mccartyi]
MKSNNQQEQAHKHTPGDFAPVINTSKCEGDGECVLVCPNDVFEIYQLSALEKNQLPFISRLKVSAHGSKQARLIHPERCEGCGNCVSACHEKAIKLKKNLQG